MVQFRFEKYQVNEDANMGSRGALLLKRTFSIVFYLAGVNSLRILIKLLYEGCFMRHIRVSLLSDSSAGSHAVSAVSLFL